MPGNVVAKSKSSHASATPHRYEISPMLVPRIEPSGLMMVSDVVQEPTRKSRPRCGEAAAEKVEDRVGVGSKARVSNANVASHVRSP